MIWKGTNQHCAARIGKRISTVRHKGAPTSMTIVKLENRCARKRTEGSNPSLSARF